MTAETREHLLLSAHLDLSAATRAAIEELVDTIISRYPTATFRVTSVADQPGTIHLIAAVDVDDPDEVGDLVVDRVVALQAEDGIPLHVIPVRAPE